MAGSTAAAARQPPQGPAASALQAQQAATPLFAPAYPSGPSYDVWVATLPGFGLLSDSDGDGSLANERGSSNGESELQSPRRRSTWPPSWPTPPATSSWSSWAKAPMRPPV